MEKYKIEKIQMEEYEMNECEECEKCKHEWYIISHSRMKCKKCGEDDEYKRWYRRNSCN